MVYDICHPSESTIISDLDWHSQALPLRDKAGGFIVIRVGSKDGHLRPLTVWGLIFKI